MGQYCCFNISSSTYCKNVLMADFRTSCLLSKDVLKYISCGEQGYMVKRTEFSPWADMQINSISTITSFATLGRFLDFYKLFEFIT